MSLWISKDGTRASHGCLKCGAKDEYTDVIPKLAALERVAKAAKALVSTPCDTYDCGMKQGEPYRHLSDAVLELYRSTLPPDSDGGEVADK